MKWKLLIERLTLNVKTSHFIVFTDVKSGKIEVKLYNLYIKPFHQLENSIHIAERKITDAKSDFPLIRSMVRT